MCFNRKVLGGLAVVALGVWLFAPKLLGGVAPLLLVAACPLSMILMMRAMSGGRRQTEEAPGRTSRAEGGEAEIAHLQAEIERLRAERAEAPSSPVSPPGPTRA